jgi:hypothetical protein
MLLVGLHEGEVQGPVDEAARLELAQVTVAMTVGVVLDVLQLLFACHGLLLQITKAFRAVGFPGFLSSFLECIWGVDPGDSAFDIADVGLGNPKATRDLALRNSCRTQTTDLLDILTGQLRERMSIHDGRGSVSFGVSTILGWRTPPNIRETIICSNPVFV